MTKVGKLIERAKSGKQLDLGPKGPELEPILAYLECIFDARANGISLSEDDQDFLVEIAKDYVLSARRGHPEGPSHELNRAKQCAFMLFEIGKQEYRAAQGLDRLRKDLQHPIARRAIAVMEQKFPKQVGKIKPDDLLDYNGRPTLTDDEFNQNFPDAREQMRDLPAPSRR